VAPAAKPMPRRAQAIGAVLAGGGGRRIGGDKAIVELDGRPLVSYPIDALRAVLDEIAVVAKRRTVLPPLRGAATVYHEPDEPRHPLAGVVHALRLARGRPVVAVAADMPLVGPALVRALVEADAGGRPAVVPRAGGRLQPLFARYEPAALEALDRFDITARATDLVAALGVAELPFDDETPFFNVNAPEDLLQASALLASRR
jgi:molybdopterin-guanine dinucleotide biosynthesis protein A